MNKTIPDIIDEIVKDYTTTPFQASGLRVSLEFLAAVANREGFVDAVEKVQKM